MTEAAGRHPTHSVLAYDVSAGGIVPTVFAPAKGLRGEPLLEDTEAISRSTALVLEHISDQIRSVDELLARLGLEYRHVPDPPLLEAPDDASYEDAYSWEDVRMSVLSGDSTLPQYSDSEIWR